MAKRCMALLLLIGLVALDVEAQAPDQSASKNKRTVYLVRHGAAKDLAGVLGRHFKGDAEVQVLPDSPSNCLLISAPPAVFTEVVQLLDQLDRRPRLVAVELLIAEVPPKKGEAGKGIDEKDLTGSGPEVLEKVEALRKKGLLGSLKRIQLTAVENQPASAAVGETKPVVTGIRNRGDGQVLRSITYRNVGTTARLTVRVADEKTIGVDLDVMDARLHFPEGGAELGKDEAGNPVVAPEFINASLKTRLSVPAGQAVAAQGVKTDSKSGQAQTVIVVTARVVAPDAKGNP